MQIFWHLFIMSYHHKWIILQPSNYDFAITSISPSTLQCHRGYGAWWHWPPQLTGGELLLPPRVSWGCEISLVVWAMMRKGIKTHLTGPKTEEEGTLSMSISLLPLKSWECQKLVILLPLSWGRTTIMSSLY